MYAADAAPALTRSLPRHPHSAPEQVVLEGHTGRWKYLMGLYELSTLKANGAPVYVKTLEGAGGGGGGGGGGGHKHYLFRKSNGEWMATCKESSIAKNAGGICSSRAADLPTDGGLGWQWGNGKGTWTDDPKLSCTAVRLHPSLPPPPSTSPTSPRPPLDPTPTWDSSRSGSSRRFGRG